MKKPISPKPKNKKQAIIVEQQVPTIAPSIKSRRGLNLLFVFLVISALGGAGYSYIKYQELKSNSVSNTTDRSKIKSEQIIQDLGKVLLITEQDAPTVARVDNPGLLMSSNPEFYKDVQVDDYIIVYTARAIIYRTSNNQIINIAPIVKTADQGD